MCGLSPDGITLGLSRRRVAAQFGAAAAGMIGGATLVTGAGAQQGTPPAPDIPPDFRVVLHVSEPSHWPYALSNLDNLRQEWPHSRLRVVVDGTGVFPLQGTNEVTAALAKAAAAGVAVHVCPNALKEHGVDPATIPSYALTTLGGVVALVVAHREGYVYVKP